MKRYARSFAKISNLYQSIHQQLSLYAVARFAIALLVLAISAITIPAAYSQTFSVLYNFGTNSGDPNQPSGSGIMAQGRDGNLYSGAFGGANGLGAVFQVTPAGTLKVLHSFDLNDGANPLGGLTLGTDGNFYGTTFAAGTYGFGTVFKITRSGSFTSLYSFTGGNDGGNPLAPPVEGTDGNFYGTLSDEGVVGFYGAVYKITPSGKFKVLYQFDKIHGYGPRAPLVQGTDGNFYGTTVYGGTTGITPQDGVVFKVTPAGKLTVLYSFDNTHGRYPVGPLVQGTDGNFYGTTSAGGSFYAGVIFKITPAGKLTVLHNMNGTTDGGVSYAGLVQATDGNFYGANAQNGKVSSGCPSGCGTTFEVTTKGKLTVLHNFDLTTGSTPSVTPFQHTNGLVYGDTQQGGTGNLPPCSGDYGSCGVFYSLNDSLPAFVSLLPTSGKVGNVIGILGQGFSGSSVVKFHGVQATSVKRTGSTFLSVTVPSGALTGSVTVSTGATKLTSNKPFRVTSQIP